MASRQTRCSEVRTVYLVIRSSFASIFWGRKPKCGADINICQESSGSGVVWMVEDEAPTPRRVRPREETWAPRPITPWLGVCPNMSLRGADIRGTTGPVDGLAFPQKLTQKIKPDLLAHWIQFPWAPFNLSGRHNLKSPLLTGTGPARDSCVQGAQCLKNWESCELSPVLAMLGGALKEPQFKKTWHIKVRQEEWQESWKLRFEEASRNWGCLAKKRKGMVAAF